MKLLIKQEKGAKLPTRGSDFAAGYDLYGNNDESVYIAPGQNQLIDTGLIIEIPQGYFGAIFPRSGIATKRGGRLSNCVGVVDCDYRDTWKISMYNDSDEQLIITPHERIAQFIVLPYQDLEFIETDIVSETERGTGGFGSTGEK